MPTQRGYGRRGPAGPSAYICVEAYDDGASTDNDMLSAALADLSPGGRIVLKAGKTYTLTRSWDIAKKAVIDLNGATLTRANQLSTTLTANANAGTSTIQVASAAGFAIGDKITVIDGPSGTGLKTEARIITNIVGNTLTTGVLSGNCVTGNTCLRVISLITATEDIEIFGGTLLGNAANNTLTEAWQLNWAIDCSATKKLYAHDLIIADSPNESMTGGRGSVIERIKATNLKGSIFHCSDNQGNPPYHGGFLIDSVVATNVCTSSINGHNECWITASNNTWDVSITNCRIDGTRAAIPNIDANDNRLFLQNCVIKNASQVSSIAAGTSQVTVGNVSIDNCQFFNASDFLFQGNDVRKGFAVENIHISNTRFEDSRLAFINVRNITLHNNLVAFTQTYVAASALATIPASVLFNNFDRVTITDSVFEGPRVHQPGILAGLHLDLNTSLKRKTAAGADTVHLYPSGVHVSNVTIANFPRGLSNYQTYGATVLNSVTGWTYNDIRVWSAREGNGYASSNATWAIQVPAGCIARDLSIFTQFSTSNGNYIPLQIYGINSTGAIADCRGGFVDGATIIHVTSQGAIVCAAGAVGNLSRHNIVTRNIRTSFVTPTYFVQDATNSSLEAMTNIGVTVLPSLTSEDPHQYYGLAENSGQY